MKNALVLGDGKLAQEIVKQSGWPFISRKKDNFDVETLGSFKSHIPKDVNIIINCIANTETHSTDKDAHWNINYKFVYHLSNYCLMNKIKLIHISTDYVYANCKSHPSSEKDIPVHAENWYSYTKLLGDAVIELLLEDFLICRCTHKERHFTYESAFIDKICNYTYTDEAAKMIIDLINKNAVGVYNIGKDPVIVYDHLKKSNPKILASVTPAGIPKDTSMEIKKMKTTLNL